MIKIYETKEVADKLGKSLRATQRLLRKENEFRTIEIWENGVLRLGVKADVLDGYLATNSKNR